MCLLNLSPRSAGAFLDSIMVIDTEIRKVIVGVFGLFDVRAETGSENDLNGVLFAV